MDRGNWWIALIGGVVVFFGALAKTVTTLRRTARVFDVILGYEELGKQHPGVEERLTNLEEQVAELNRLLSQKEPGRP